ncbi:hypothetical protein [Nocardia beijingensis]
MGELGELVNGPRDPDPPARQVNVIEYEIPQRVRSDGIDPDQTDDDALPRRNGRSGDCVHLVVGHRQQRAVAPRGPAGDSAVASTSGAPMVIAPRFRCGHSASGARLEEIHDNLEARIVEPKREAWLGEVEGLQVSYAGVKDKLAQIDATLMRTATGTDLGIPMFGSISGRASAP